MVSIVTHKNVKGVSKSGPLETTTTTTRASSRAPHLGSSVFGSILIRGLRLLSLDGLQ